MSKNAKRSKFAVLEQKMLKSKAYRALKTPTAYSVLAIFWTKRQLAKAGRHGKKHWVITNNGEIVFTYQEAKTRYGISGGAFRTAIDELIDKGFIDITATGRGVYKVTTLYSVSKRWERYATPEYEKPKPRRKGPINRGFQKGNKRYNRKLWIGR